MCPGTDRSSHGCGDGARLGDLARDDRCVFSDPNQQRGLAFAQEVHAAEVQAWRDGARAVLVDREAQLVERLYVDPARVVRSEPRGEYRRAEAGQVELDWRPRVERRRIGHLGHGDLAGRAELGDLRPRLVVALIAERDRLGEVGREVGPPVLGAEEVAYQRYAYLLEHP